MRTTSARAPGPNKRKGRTATVQPLQNSFHISSNADSSTLRQVQFLTAHFGIPTVRASLVAALCWGNHNG
jgi:hypothetical protein